ncbi:hypothetical protein ABZX85_39540 [Streptomyces sp. NPDC004539]|uniref:hypothetical protein n=1 Tax=Streptomyces sp. NPDC004539 TaxID=3154280 RepID=UPI0033B8D17A
MTALLNTTSQRLSEISAVDPVAEEPATSRRVAALTRTTAPGHGRQPPPAAVPPTPARLASAASR